MPHTTATTTAAKLPSGSWEGIHVQNLDPATDVYVGREASLTTSGATGGLRLFPGQTLSLRRSNGYPGAGGPYVRTESGTVTVAWELFL